MKYILSKYIKVLSRLKAAKNFSILFIHYMIHGRNWDYSKNPNEQIKINKLFLFCKIFRVLESGIINVRTSSIQNKHVKPFLT